MEQMTIEEIRERVEEIRSLSHSDAEAAHSKRDDLMIDVLRHIEEWSSHGGDAFLAEEALKACDIKLRFEACA